MYTFILSLKEQQVLQLICEDHTTKEIGKICNMSGRTVEHYRSNLRKVFNVKTISGLVYKAVKFDYYQINNTVQSDLVLILFHKIDPKMLPPERAENIKKKLEGLLSLFS